MPTYEYLCQTCSHRFETWQKMADEPLTTCPECGAHIRRVLFPAGVVFKGSGFYKTDYNNSKSKDVPTDESHSNGSSQDGENKKTESTTENKSASESTTSDNKKTESKISESKPASSNGSSSSSSTNESKTSTSATR